jgi:hypothetical protein
MFAMKIMDKKRVSRMISTFQDVDGCIKHQTGLDLVSNEIKILRHLYHRNVILLYEVVLINYNVYQFSN